MYKIDKHPILDVKDGEKVIGNRRGLMDIAKRLKDRLLFSYQSYTLSVNDQELFTEIDSFKSLKSFKN